MEKAGKLVFALEAYLRLGIRWLIHGTFRMAAFSEARKAIRR